MARAAKMCSTPNCPNLQPCDEHKKIAWEGSRRKQHLTVSGWEQQRRSRFVITRDAGICHVCGLAGADQADHVIPLAQGGADSLTNLKAIHAKPCHADKTLEEARRARNG